MVFRTQKLRYSSNPPRLPTFLKPSRTPAPATRNTVWTSKNVANTSILTILTSKSLSRYNGVHFLKIKTSKSGPNLAVFNDFDFEIALSLQRVQFLTILTSKSAPRPPVFNDFDFQIALSPQRDAILKILT